MRRSHSQMPFVISPPLIDRPTQEITESLADNVREEKSGWPVIQPAGDLASRSRMMASLT